MNDHNCKACRFYMVTGVMEGICRQRPPHPTIVGGPNGQPMTITAWPTVKPDMWCGQFEPTQAKLQVVES